MIKYIILYGVLFPAIMFASNIPISDQSTQFSIIHSSNSSLKISINTGDIIVNEVYSNANNFVRLNLTND